MKNIALLFLMITSSNFAAQLPIAQPADYPIAQPLSDGNSYQPYFPLPVAQEADLRSDNFKFLCAVFQGDPTTMRKLLDAGKVTNPAEIEVSVMGPLLDVINATKFPKRKEVLGLIGNSADDEPNFIYRDLSKYIRVAHCRFRKPQFKLTSSGIHDNREEDLDSPVISDRSRLARNAIEGNLVKVRSLLKSVPDRDISVTVCGTLGSLLRRLNNDKNPAMVHYLSYAGFKSGKGVAFCNKNLVSSAKSDWFTTEKTVSINVRPLYLYDEHNIEQDPVSA